MHSALCRAPAARISLAPRRGRLAVQANTLWSLAPRDGEKERRHKHAVDLTAAIGARRVCSVGAKDYAEKATDSIDFTVVDHGGVHILFEAEGCSNPLDSPSVLFVTDVDSECEVLVGGNPLRKGKRTRVRPGETIEMGENATYVVHRNVFAHA